jgi:hypothetical protein
MRRSMFPRTAGKCRRGLQIVIAGVPFMACQRNWLLRDDDGASLLGGFRNSLLGWADGQANSTGGGRTGI